MLIVIVFFGHPCFESGCLSAVIMCFYSSAVMGRQTELKGIEWSFAECMQSIDWVRLCDGTNDRRCCAVLVAFDVLCADVVLCSICSNCMQQIMESVDYCHQMNIIHRDLKVVISFH